LHVCNTGNKGKGGDELVKKRAKRDTYPYLLKNGRKTVYIGITKDPNRREQEHKSEGKRFTQMIRKFPCGEETARKREEEMIKRYKRNHGGKKPRYND
jgi:predicted GIY-YIG superfamily endonuclease